MDRLALWATLIMLVGGVLLQPIISKIRRRGKTERPDGLSPFAEPETVDFEIVTVHGLGANPEYTWKTPSRSTDSEHKTRIHLLDLVKEDFPTARILTFSYNSDWLIDAPVKSAQQIAGQLLDKLAKHRSKHPRVPIVFIGHSFGGIVIKKALCNDDVQEIIDSTSGILFLGTPHQGSSLSRLGIVAARMTAFLGSDVGLLLSLMNHQKELSDLDRRFLQRMKDKEDRRQQTEITAFCETKPTYVLGFSVGLIVTEDSARGGHGATAIDIDSDHSGLNKCRGRKDELYIQLKERLENLQPTTKQTLNGNQKFVVDNLRTVERAGFNKHADTDNARCYPSTRSDILEQISKWAAKSDGSHIFWLNGQAGTGKSTISRTAAQALADKNTLGASFFFKRGEGDRSRATLLFPSIAAQLVRQLPSIAPYIRNEIESDPTVYNNPLKDQFDKLILNPIYMVNKPPQSITMIIVLDALDECDNLDDVKLVIYLLSKLQRSPSIRLRFLVTSRPELPIQLGFKDIDGTYEAIVLQEIPQSVIKHDITVFLEHDLAEIRRAYNQSVETDRQVPSDWPGADIQKLVNMAVPLFILAATICRFLRDRRLGRPQDQLQRILDQKRSQGSHLNDTYLPVVERLWWDLPGSMRQNVIERFKHVVGSIVLLADPLSKASLARLLGTSLNDVEDQLDLLHSVLSVPLDRCSPVRLLHLSFREFLIDPEKGGEDGKYPFWVDERQTHHKLATRCLQLLSTPDVLKQDICNLQQPGAARTDITQQTIAACLPLEVQYACQYWVFHWKESKILIRDGDDVDCFLTRYLLQWLEALSIIGRFSESVGMIGDLLGCLSVSF